jgi:ABC-2 type transport system ATP-binding protein
VNTSAPDHRPASAALNVNNVRFTYPSRGGRGRGHQSPARQPTVALDGVSLSIPPGQSVAMLGPNGSGKSTLMRIICGLQQADSGQVRIFDQENTATGRRFLGVVFQSPSLDPHLTVFENLRDQSALYGLDQHAMTRTVDEELQRWNLLNRRNSLVKTLSQGLARRVDLLRAMLHQPRLLLLDEPTVGLDPAAREQFLRDLESLRQANGLTILMSTHLVDEADRQDRVLLMHHGRLIADDTPTNLRGQAGDRVITVMNPQWQPEAQIAGLWEKTPDGWRSPLIRNDERSTGLLANLAASDEPFSVGPPTLADVFEKLTGASLHPGSIE